MSESTATQVRTILIVGPSAASSYLWEASLDLAYAGGGDRPVVQKTPALRVLAHDQEASSEVARHPGVLFHHPGLLHAAVGPGPDSSPFKLFPQEMHHPPARELRLTRDRAQDPVDVLLRPVNSPDKWPTGTDPEILVPRMQLVAGRIPVLLQIVWGPGHWLGSDRRGFLFADGVRGLEVKPNRDGRLPAALTPEGIEFVGRVPDPGGSVGEPSALIWALLRLTPAAPGPQTNSVGIDLISPVDDPVGNWNDLDALDPNRGAAIGSALRKGFAALKAFDVEARIDDRSGFPDLAFALSAMDPSGFPAFTHRADRFALALEPRQVAANLLSGKAEAVTAAGLALTGVLLARNGDAGSIALECRSAEMRSIPGTPVVEPRRGLGGLVDRVAAFLGGGARQPERVDPGPPPAGERVDFALDRTDPAGGWTLAQDMSILRARLPLAAVRDELRRLYDARRLIDPARDDGAVSAFLPVARGWLQLPLPAVPPAEHAVSSSPRPSALSGSAHLAVGRCAIALEQAETLIVKADFGPRGPLPAPKVLKLRIQAEVASGYLHGLAWRATNSPSDGEILPRLRPGSTTDWGIAFGQQIPPRDALPAAVTLSETGSTLSMTSASSLKPIAWLSDQRHAWVSTMNLSQTGAVRLPSPGRSLVPWTLQAIVLRCSFDADTRPKLTLDGATLWAPWTELKVMQSLPTLPGLERALGDGAAKFVVRHDLSLLDDLFAGMVLEEPRLFLLGENAGSLKPEPLTAPIPTAVAPDLLKGAWKNADRDRRLTLTRQRVAVAEVADGAASSLENLVQPARLPVTFNFDAGDDPTHPLGRFRLKPAASAAVSFAGNSALAWWQEPIEVGGQPVAIVGGAAESFERGDFHYDSAGIGFDGNKSFAPRVTARLPGTAEHALVTLSVEQVVRDESGLRVHFWCRDLPAVRERHDGAWRLRADSIICRHEALAASDTGTREAISLSGYEWRLWQTSDTSDPEHPFRQDVDLGGGLRARPLRLAEAIFTDDDRPELRSMEVVAAALMPGLDSDPRAQPGAASPAMNLILLRFWLDDTSWRHEVRGYVPPGAPAGAAPGPITFQISPRLLLGGKEPKDSPPPRPGTLSLIVGPGVTEGVPAGRRGQSAPPIQLEMRLFGRDIPLKAETLTEGRIAFSHEPESAGPLALSSIVLTWTPGRIGTATLDLQASFELFETGVTPAMGIALLDFGERSLCWLGAKRLKVNYRVDHDCGEIRFDTDEPADPATYAPIDGFGFTSLSAVGFLLVADDAPVGAAWFECSRDEGPANERKRTRLRQHWRSGAGDPGPASIVLDLRRSATSVISWPSATPKVEAPRPDGEATVPFTVRVAGPSLTHHVEAEIRDAKISLKSLTWADPAGTGRRTALQRRVQLIESPPFRMRVGHRLEGEGRALSWTTLDEVVMLDLGRLQAGIKEEHLDETYAFAARYMNGRYRGDTGHTEVKHPGIVRRLDAMAGFPDRLIVEALRQPGDLRGIILYGAGAAAFDLGTGEEALLLTLPWLASIGDDAVLGPLSALGQSGGNQTWQTAWFDARLARVRLRTGISPLSLNDPTPKAIAAQLGGDGRASGALAAFDQSFVDRDPWDSPDLQSFPFFLRNIVAVAELWRTTSSNPAAARPVAQSVVQPIILPDRTVRLFRPSAGGVARPTSTEREQSIALIRKDRIDLVPLAGLATSEALDPPAPQILRPILQQAMGRPQGGQILAAVALNHLRSESGGDLSGLTGIEIGEIIHPAGATRPMVSQPLRPDRNALFASAALGWPGLPRIIDGNEVDAALRPGPNRAFQSRAAGVAGRAGAFVSRYGSRRDKGTYLLTRRAVQFEAAALPETDGPRPRQLDTVPRRPRMPAPADGHYVVPPRFLAGAAGLRPGVLHTETAGLIVESGPIFKDGPNTGTHQRALIRQYRAPRSSALPMHVVNLDWRRRTIVQDGSLEHRILDGPAIAFRTYGEAETVASGSILPPAGLVLIRPKDLDQFNLSNEWSGRFELKVDGPETWLPFEHVEYRLAIGRLRWPMNAKMAAWQAAGRSLVLELGETVDRAGVLACLAAADGDTVAELELLLSSQGEPIGAFRPAPFLRVAMPIPILRADRPSLPVQTASLIFGDPSYDRMIGSGTASDLRTDNRFSYQLAFDRETYDLAGPMIFAAFSNDPAVTNFHLVASRIRQDPISGHVETIKVAELRLGVNQAFGTTVANLFEQAEVDVRPGDTLQFAGKFELPGSPPSSQTAIVSVKVTADRILPPAPAAFYLVTACKASEREPESDPARTVTALSASGPVPEIVEYPNLMDDLKRGYVTRRGFFVWQLTVEPDPNPEQFASLIKIDRAGGGQLPDAARDFGPLE